MLMSAPSDMTYQPSVELGDLADVEPSVIAGALVGLTAARGALTGGDGSGTTYLARLAGEERVCASSLVGVDRSAQGS